MEVSGAIACLSGCYSGGKEKALKSENESTVPLLSPAPNPFGSRTRQHGYRLLATMEGPVATEVFRKNLADWKKEKPGALLDLIEGAEAKKSDETVAKLLADY